LILHRRALVAAGGIVMLATLMWWAVARPDGGPDVGLGGERANATERAATTQSTIAASREPDATSTAAPATTAFVSVDSLPATLPAASQPAPARSAEEISVSPDVIEFGVGLDAIDITRADGRTYVLAYHGISDEDPDNDFPLLAAFDDAGRELWRTVPDGYPSAIAVALRNLWLSDLSTVSRIERSNGQVVDDIAIGEHFSLLAAFGSVWVLQGGTRVSRDLLRIDPDGWTTVELPVTDLLHGIWSGDVPTADELDTAQFMLGNFDGATAGPDAIWVRLGGGGVAVIDPITLEVTMIPVDEIGHEVLGVASDGDAAYVTDGNRVTSIVNGKPLASVSPGPISYLGPIDGVFGMLLPEGRFEALKANDPMVVEHRQISTKHDGDAHEIDGEAWIWEGDRFVGERHDLRRLHLLDSRT